MFLIVGLGNPEPEYSRTRHNMGFDVVNKLAEKYDIQIEKNGFKGIYGIGNIEGEKVILLKPQTYMNLSGDSIIEIMKFYKLQPKDIIIVYDDVDTDIGEIRIRKKGSSGNHNGMKSVIYRLNTEEFPRIRIGTGEPEDRKQMMEYVISKVSNDEYRKLQNGVKKGEEAIIELLKNGIDIAMNKFN